MSTQCHIVVIRYGSCYDISLSHDVDVGGLQIETLRLGGTCVHRITPKKGEAYQIEVESDECIISIMT